MGRLHILGRKRSTNTDVQAALLTAARADLERVMEALSEHQAAHRQEREAWKEREADLLAANTRQHDRVVELHCAVERAANVFFDYAGKHMAKDPPAFAQADANQRLAADMCKAIGLQHPARLSDGSRKPFKAETRT